MNELQYSTDELEFTVKQYSVHYLQVKTVLNKYCMSVDFDVRGKQWLDLKEALLWITTSNFVQKEKFKVKMT